MGISPDGGDPNCIGGTFGVAAGVVVVGAAGAGDVMGVAAAPGDAIGVAVPGDAIGVADAAGEALGVACAIT